MIFTGYHSTEKSNEVKILKKGYEKSLNKIDELLWLGEGIYFWESLYYAVEWNVIKISKNQHMDNTFDNLWGNYTIISSDIECQEEEFLDISSPEGTIIFNEFKNSVLSRDNPDDIKQDLEKNIDEDPFWIYLMVVEKVFEDLKVLSAFYFKKIENNKLESGSNFLKYIQKQICVFDKSCIKNTKKYENKEKINELYEKVMSNRNEYDIRRKQWIK